MNGHHECLDAVIGEKQSSLDRSLTSIYTEVASESSAIGKGREAVSGRRSSKPYKAGIRRGCLLSQATERRGTSIVFHVL